MPSYRPTSIYADRSRALKLACGSRCFICGKAKPLAKLEWAHTKPTGLCGRGRGAKGRYLDLMKHPECYILACRWCHKRMDSSPAAARTLVTEAHQQRFLLTFTHARRIVAPYSARRAEEVKGAEA